MALSDTYTPVQFYFQIQQGAHFHLEFPPFLDATTGEPFDFPGDGAWTARMNVVNSAGAVVAEFATSGENGVITLTADGVVQLDLADEYTAALTPTSDYDSTPNGASLYADLVLVDPVDSEKWVFCSGKGQVRKQVTSG